MKLIIRQYLASLRERGELDVILPDLLSQMGLNVFTRPGRGTRQDGVDVGAVGSIDSGPERVYLFSVKPGDLSRSDWDGNSVQSLRPSLNEILDAYIPNRLPVEHRAKGITIVICIGGDVQEQVRPSLEGFINKASSRARFEEWNGDKLASLIQSWFLREDLMPERARSSLRKALAMLDEPDVAYRHFASLVHLLSCDVDTHSKRLTALRQLNICLWILFSWARDASNLEAAYRGGELAVLHAWKIVRRDLADRGKATQVALMAFISVCSAYEQISDAFLADNVHPHAGKLHALSAGIQPLCSLDVNLKLFDLLGRVAIRGVWAYFAAGLCSDGEDSVKAEFEQVVVHCMQAATAMIANNPALFLPISEEQTTSISIAAMFLAMDSANHACLKHWLSQMLARAAFAYRTHQGYPCIHRSYPDLLAHPKLGDDEYRKSATGGSVLYPTIALWAAILGDGDTYAGVARLKSELLQHCTFQFWYPDESSEAHFYTHTDIHGATLTDLWVNRPMEEFLRQVFGECERSSHFNQLSAVKYGWWPVVVVACRHYRLPLPLHLLAGLRQGTGDAASAGKQVGNDGPVGGPGSPAYRGNSSDCTSTPNMETSEDQAHEDLLERNARDVKGGEE